MSASDPKRLFELFSKALELPIDEQPSFCDAACGEDLELRRRLGEMLKAHAMSGSFLKDDPASPTPGRKTIHLQIPEMDALREGPGSVIGRYKILQQIGQGGCGTVFMAEQEQPVRRRVALKVIKLGMDTASVIGRFEAERQALAMMDHPNIAKVLDAGTTETGRPYFVMELVRGIPINQFCDQNQLDTRKRLELFVQVCQAIQHAHNKGIIHRDIKPSNILVTLTDGEPTPKVIDFGIAKATQGPLTERTVFTAFDQFVGTPAYMSPEQAQMSSMDIDSQSDIYSLGVLLYELLTGRTPFDASELAKVGIDAIRQTIREVDPPRPSSRLSTLQGEALTTTAKARRTEGMRLLAIIRGDLDWIVMKCLEKNRTRRYETASALAADLANHMSGRPVVARPPSTWYLLDRAFHRNRVLFLAGGSVIASLVLGICVSLILLIRAQKAEKILRESTDQLESIIAAVNPAIAQHPPDPGLTNVLAGTSKWLMNSFQLEPGVQMNLAITLGQMFRSSGNYQEANAIQHQILNALRHSGKDDELEGVLARNELAKTMASLRDWGQATNLYQDAIKIAQRHGLHEEEAKINIGLAYVYNSIGASGVAERLTTNDMAYIRSHFGVDHPLTVEAETRLAEIQYMSGKSRDAIATIRRIEIGRRLPGTTPNPLPRGLQFILAAALQSEGQFTEAEKVNRDHLEWTERVLGPGHLTTLLSMQLLGITLSYQGRFAEAEKVGRNVAETFEKKGGPRSADAVAARFNLAEYLRNQNKFIEAEQLLLEVLETSRQLSTTEEVDLPEKQAGLVILYQFMGRHSEAEQLARRIVDERTNANVNPTALTQAMALLSVSLLAEKKFNEAESLARKELSIQVEENPDSWSRYSAEGRLGLSLLGIGSVVEAEQRLGTAYRELIARESTVPAIDKIRIAEILKGWLDAQKALRMTWDSNLPRELGERQIRAIAHDRIGP